MLSDVLWNAHTLSICPVDPDRQVEITNQNGETHVGRAGDFYWGKDIEPEGRIAMFRVLGPVPEHPR